MSRSFIQAGWVDERAEKKKVAVAGCRVKTTLFAGFVRLFGGIPIPPFKLHITAMKGYPLFQMHSVVCFVSHLLENFE
jgi:hypothetical protein